MPTFRFVPERSQVWIDATSSLHPIRAGATGLSGWLEAAVRRDGRLDLTVAPRGHLELPVDRLTSGNPLYDREIRRRVDVRRFPTATAELGRVAPGNRPDRYLVGGGITFRGVTRDYEDEMTVTAPDRGTLCLEGERVFDMRDFGLDPPRILALRVHPEVTVRVRLVAERAS